MMTKRLATLNKGANEPFKFPNADKMIRNSYLPIPLEETTPAIQLRAANWLATS